MNEQAPKAGITLAYLAQFDDIIDARSPGEFAEDHIPGARNCPVLDNEERARVGTIYKQVSAFDAKKIGAALVAKNIARHIEESFAAQPRTWRPLVYCWRGGSRSGAMTHIFSKIGWRAEQLDGGYKAYRRNVLEILETLPQRLTYRVICGATGTGKSRLLAAIARLGGQVLDLEGLAAHRGSLLGNLPDEPQPSQKLFESRLWAALQQFDPATPVFVEAESKKIGNLRVPDAVLSAMWQSPCMRLEAAVPLRVALLMEEYRHFLNDPQALNAKLAFLVNLHGKETIARWQEASLRHEWHTLVEELLVRHYDPSYTRASRSHYPDYDESPVLAVNGIGENDYDELAKKALEAA
ncbi:MAG: tRNA 2-selenouridine(34) synthase MnmH [Sulfuricella sp.]|nr:tRNA 2-selenouridine(34) synthase MnmH [Sulfuricella sp.]